MTTTMTERDKKLLLLMACTVLLVGFGIGIIKPLLEAGQDMNTEIIEAQDQKILMENRVITYDQMKSVAEESAVMAEDAAHRYYGPMQSQDIDREITSVVLSQGLNVEQLTIAMPEGTYPIVPYPFSEMAASMMTPEEMGTEDAETTEETTEEGSFASEDGMGAVATSVSAANVQIAVTGTKDAFWNLLNAFENHKEEIRVVRMSFGSAGTGSQEMDTMTVELEVFMCDTELITE